MIYSEARDYARDDLQASDFEREPEYEEEELNYQLNELRNAVTEVYGELTQPGPWRGIAEGDDVPKAIAEIKALVNKLLVPAVSVEEAIVEARISGLLRQRGTRKVVEGRRWRARLDFENAVAEATREAGWDGRPLEYRLACMDQLIAEAQRYRATIARDHHHDAWMKQQP